MSARNCPLVGNCADLKENSLQIYQDVLKFFYYTRLNHPSRNPSFKEISRIVVDRLIAIWRRSSLPHLSDSRVRDMLKASIEKRKQLMKSIKKTFNKTNQRIQEVKKHAETNLFDITSCKCVSFQQCCCAVDRKVPEIE